MQSVTSMHFRLGWKNNKYTRPRDEFTGKTKVQDAEGGQWRYILHDLKGHEVREEQMSSALNFEGCIGIRQVKRK